MKIKRFKSENGAVVVIVALSIVALMMVTALTIDVGSLYEERRHLQTVADAAALAGAQELPESSPNAIQVAINYAASHGVDITSDDVEISQTYVPKDTITVTPSNPDTPVYFAKVIGIDSVNVGANATAMVGSPEEVCNVVPWGAYVPKDADVDEEGFWEDWLSPGEDKILKFGAGEAIEGNFYALDLDGVTGGGNPDYVDGIINGYPMPLSVGDIILTEPGNMATTVSATNTRVGVWDFFEGLVTYDESGNIKLVKSDTQFVMVPVIYELEDPTGQESVVILAFAPFILTEIPPGPLGQAQIIGKFIHQALIVTSGKVGGVGPVGLRVIRLID